jgi:hypothetical protein
VPVVDDLPQQHVGEVGARGEQAHTLVEAVPAEEGVTHWTNATLVRWTWTKVPLVQRGPDTRPQ